MEKIHFSEIRLLSSQFTWNVFHLQDANVKIKLQHYVSTFNLFNIK